MSRAKVKGGAVAKPEPRARVLAFKREGAKPGSMGGVYRDAAAAVRAAEASRKPEDIAIAQTKLAAAYLSAAKHWHGWASGAILEDDVSAELGRQLAMNSVVCADLWELDVKLMDVTPVRARPADVVDLATVRRVVQAEKRRGAKGGV